MRSYFIRRLLLIVPTFLGITILVFTITRFVPGGPIERMISQAQMMQNMQGRVQSQTSGIGNTALSKEQIDHLNNYVAYINESSHILKETSTHTNKHPPIYPNIPTYSLIHTYIPPTNARISPAPLHPFHTSC